MREDSERTARNMRERAETEISERRRTLAQQKEDQAATRRMEEKNYSIQTQNSNRELEGLRLQAQRDSQQAALDIKASNQIFETSPWSKYLESNLLKVFNSTFKVDDYLDSDLSNNERISRIKQNKTNILDINKEFIDTFVEINKKHEINGWSTFSTEKLKLWKKELTFTHLVNYHFMYNLKKREGYWSWFLIVISTICSTLTVLNISEPFMSSVVKYVITFFSVITSLIAAYMKKENFVERIKEMDRYIQKVGHIQVEIENLLRCKPWNRISYKDFHDKNYTDIVQLFSAPPPISPDEFKETIYNLTVYNPELLMEAYPWFQANKLGNEEYFEMTEFGNQIIRTYTNTAYKKFCCCLCLYNCINQIQKNQFIKFEEYNNNLTTSIVSNKKTKLGLTREVLELDNELKNLNKHNNETDDEVNLSINSNNIEIFNNQDDKHIKPGKDNDINEIV